MKKSRKFLSVILCICLFAAFAMGSGSSDDKKPAANKVGEVTSTDSKDDSSKDTTDVKESDTNKDSSTKKDTVDDKKEYRVGETVSYKGLDIVFTDSCYYTSDNDFIQPNEGNTFIRLYFHVDNQSGSDKTVSVFDFNCYADGYECEATYFDDDISASLSNGRTGDGAVYFEIPEGSVDVEIEYDLDWLEDKKVKFIFEGDKSSGLEFEASTSASEDAFHVGDIVETKNLKITYLKADEYDSDNMFLQPNEGMKYVYIELEIENISDSDQNISYFSFNCFADGKSCDGFYGMDDLLSADLSAGRKAKGTIAAEVPVDAQTIEFEYEDNFWTESKVIFLYE